MPAGTGVSGLEADGAGCFFCGGGSSGKVPSSVGRNEVLPAGSDFESPARSK